MATGENGDDVIIYVGANAIGSQRNVTLNSEMTVIETSAKGDAEATFIAGRTTHSVDLDGLYVNGDSAWDDLSAAMEGQTSITLMRYRNSSFVASATAYVTSLSRSHPDMDVATVSASFQITGTWSSGL
jgi:hypothetical protein